jgi:hypothetical protein
LIITFQTNECRKAATGQKPNHPPTDFPHNELECQPRFSLLPARVYLNGADPKLSTRAWHEVMENHVTQKADETRRRNYAIGVPPAGLYQAFDIKCDSHLTAKIQR